MKKSICDRITYHENSVAVARTLRDRGYDIADSNGIRQSEPDKYVVGILKPGQPIQNSFLGFKWDSLEALYIGRLWLKDQATGAKLDENWVLEIYGRAYVPELTELVKELSEPHQTQVQIRLESEKPFIERYLSDFDY